MAANLIPVSSDGGFVTSGNITGGNIIGPLANGNSNVRIATANSNVAITSNGTHTWNFGDTGNLTLPANSFAVNYANGTQVSIGGGSSINNEDSNVSVATPDGAIIITANAGTAYQWEFNTTGSLTVPGDIRGTGSNSYLNLGEPGDDLITLKSNPDVGLVLFSTSASLLGNSNVSITANTGANSLTWRFDSAGNLTLPANTFSVNYANGTQVSLGGGLPLANGNSNINIATANSNVTITSNGIHTWNFGATGNLTVPGQINGAINAEVTLSAYDNGENPTAGLYNWNVANGSVTTAISVTNTVVGISSNISGTIKNWVFDDTGNLTLPANSFAVNYANGTQVSLDGTIQSTISNGNSNVSMATANGNVTIAAVGNTVMTITGTGANITGTLSASSNANIGNIETGIITATGNGTFGNLITSGAGGNITGANVITANIFSATGDIYAGTDFTSITIGANGNITGADVIFANTFSAIGNITASYFIGNGSQLTDINGSNVGNVANANYANFAGTVVNSTQSNITSLGTLTSLSVSGNANIGNIGATNGIFTTVAGSLTTNSQPNITSTGTLASLSVSGNSNIGNIGTGIITATGNITGANLFTGGVVSATGNVTGNYFIGNGSQLTNVTALNANVATVGNNQEYRPLLVTNTTGNLPFKASTGISWNPSTYALTAGKILLGSGIGAQGVTGAYAFGGNTAWQIQSQNGTGTDAQGQEIGRFGSEYTSGPSTFWDSYTSYYQGSGASSGWMILNAAGNSVANVTGTGIAVTGTLSANGNITGGNLIGTLANGNSNVNIPSANGNVNISAVGNANILVVTGTGANVNGNLSVSGNISGNTNGFTIGYLNIPQVAAGNVTLGATDAGKHYYSTTAGNLTLTIPLNSSVPFNTGTAISIFVQAAGNILVNAASGVTLYQAGNSTAANRIVGAYGMATLIKVASDTWFINGTGVA